MKFYEKELDRLKSLGLFRSTKVVSRVDGPIATIAGRMVVSFCSNDYLGLAQHPKVRAAAIAAIKEFGAGSGAARLLAGTLSLHTRLEKSIANMKGAEEALLFTSGYAANLGVMTTMADRDSLVIADSLNHASMIDGCRLSGAKVVVYPHRNISAVKKRVPGMKRRFSRKFIVTDAVFSMDGDVAPLEEICDFADRIGAMVVLDEAHATGVLGKRGLGLAELTGLSDRIAVPVGTFSKALGGIGGFVTGSHELIGFLRNKARPFIFTTSLPPASCAASIEAMRLMRSKPALRERLWKNADYFKRRVTALGLDMRGSETPIVPIMVGDHVKASEISRKLWKEGIYVPAIRPPTVPMGESRLRIVVTAMHTKQQLDHLLAVLARTL
jgi:8-amino-7-oxononanoate synthase